MSVLRKELFVAAKKKIVYSLLFGFVFSCCIIIGDVIYYGNSNSYLELAKAQMVFALFKLFLTVLGSVALFWVILSINIKIKSTEIYTGRKAFLISWIGMVVCYLPALIAFLPGLLAYDTRWQTYQIYGIYPMTNHHPLLHTYLWKLFLWIGECCGSLELGIMFYSIFQLIVMTAIFTLFVSWFGKKLHSKRVQIITYLFFSLNPTFHLLVIQSDKDVLFGGCMLLWSCYLVDALLDRRFSIKLIIMTILGCAFRHNGFYAILVMAVLLLAVCCLAKKLRRKYIKMVWSLLIGAGIYFILIQSCLGIMGIQGASVKEMLSVPCSQLASVYLDELYVSPNRTLSEEDQALIEEYIPTCEAYNLRLADFVKGNFNEVAFKEKPKEFIGLWFRGLVNYPVRYVYSYAQLTVYYWCPSALDFPDVYSGETYIQTERRDPWDIIIVEDWNVWKEMRNFYHSIGDFSNPIMRLPIVSFMFSLSFPLFMLMFCICKILYHKEYKKVVLILFPMIYMCTLFVGPVCNFRYIFPILLQMPLLFAILFIKEKRG